MSNLWECANKWEDVGWRENASPSSQLPFNRMYEVVVLSSDAFVTQMSDCSPLACRFTASARNHTMDRAFVSELTARLGCEGAFTHAALFRLLHWFHPLRESRGEFVHWKHELVESMCERSTGLQSDVARLDASPRDGVY